MSDDRPLVERLRDKTPRRKDYHDAIREEAATRIETLEGALARVGVILQDSAPSEGGNAMTTCERQHRQSLRNIRKILREVGP